MEGTQTFEGSPSGGLQGDVLGDHLVNPGAFADKCNVLISDPACHVGSLRPVRVVHVRCEQVR